MVINKIPPLLSFLIDPDYAKIKIQEPQLWVKIMPSVLIIGAGNIGKLVASLLANTNDYQVLMIDQHPIDFPADYQQPTNLQTAQCAIDDIATLKDLVKQYQIEAIVSCLPYFCCLDVAQFAATHQLHYFDLTEDVNTTQAIQKLITNTDTIFAPQCGLAPGFISIVANHLMQGFDQVHTVKLRVGALPLNVSNPLNYALTWSTDGLINEYGNPCQIILRNKLTQVPPLEGLEEIKIDGLTYEAFHTSGGIGSLLQTYQDKVRHMDYKTMRYPGHCDKIRFLMNDLRLNDDRSVLKNILENALPRALQDVVIVYVSVQGTQNGQSLVEATYAEKFYPEQHFGLTWSAIQMTTASSLCVTVDLALQDKTLTGPLIKQENINLTTQFLPNRFGQYFDK